MNTFMWGAIAMACWAIGVFFVHFWRTTGDRLLLLFGAAFWMLGLHWVALAVIGAADETRHYFYVIRLFAFLLILGGIIDKNRSSKK